jgi:HAD superfamily hydrolase (TIGR01509 family)
VTRPDAGTVAAADRRHDDGVLVVAFDLMDTLVHDPFREALVAATGVSLRDLFTRRDAEVYPAFERGEIDEATYWASYPEAGIDVDPERFHEVRRAETRWLPGMRELVADVRAAGVGVVVASNYPHWLAEHADGMLAGLVDDVVGSYQLGARKPDPRFYEGLLARLDADPGRVALVDDREVNLDGAAAVGLPTVVAEHADQVRARLHALGVPTGRR